MTTRTTTIRTTGHTTRNSANAGLSPGVIFGRRITSCTAPNPAHNSDDRTASDNHLVPGGDDYPDDEDRGDGDEPEDGHPGEPDDPPSDDGPGDHPDCDSEPDNDGEVEHNLAHAISTLAKNVKCQEDGSRSKVREPDPFDGSDPTKLRTFLVQLQLSFNDRPTTFIRDDRKINFAISYLKGTALAHFENSLLEPDLINPPEWKNDYEEFVQELKLYFGSPDVVGEAKTKLENLSMKSSQHITKYLVEFNRLTTMTGWDNRALRHQFYHGLPARIKDKVSQVGKPATLPQLRTLAQSIDRHYWERDEETCRERGTQSSEKKTEKPRNQPTTSAQGSSGKTNKKPFVPRDSNNSGKSDKKTADLGDKIGKDGKLTAVERAHRFANNLCLFCGGLGHTVKDCPKSSSSKAKGRAAKIKPDEKSDSR